MFQLFSVLAMTGAISGTSKEKLYQELGLESLEKRQWYRKLYVYKTFNKPLTYLLHTNLLHTVLNILPVSSKSYFTR